MAGGNHDETSMLFEKVKREVCASIRRGRYPVGDVLPSVETLAAETECSSGTVRRALTELAQTGLVKRVRRRGTVVMRQPVLGRVCLLLGREPHTNLLLQDALYEQMTHAGYEVDMIPSVAHTADELLARCAVLKNRSEPTEILVAIEPGWAGPLEKDSLLPRLFASFRQKVIFSFSSTQQYQDVPQVSPDHQLVAREVVKHLLALGHRRIGLMAGLREGERSWAADAAQHAVHMLEVAGAEGRLHYICDGNEVRITERIKQESITAFWCITDHQAVLLVNACHRAGISIPGDVSIVGRHDTPWSQECTPSLTTVSLNPAGLARAVVELLDSQAGSPPCELPLWVRLVEPMLIVRDSTSPVQTTR